MVRIKRNTGLMGAGSRIKLYVNDEKVAAIKQNKQVEVDLPNEEAQIYVTQLGVRSNELSVKAGQVVEITTKSWSLIGLVSFIIVISLLNTLLPSSWRLVVAIIITLIYLSIYRFVNGFELKVIYP